MAVKIIHKNSRVEFKNAEGGQLDFGELALNYNESGPYLQCKDANGEVINLGGVYLSDSPTADAPGDPLPGRMWLRYDTLFIWDGDNWVEIAGGGGGGGTPGSVTIIGGDGIEAVTIGSTVTITADINENRGLDIVGDSIAVKLGTGLEFDAQGRIKVIDSYKPISVAEGEGIDISQSGDVYTISADVDDDRGIEIVANKIAAKLGSGLSFDGDGKIQSDVTGGIKGSVDVTGTNFPAGVQDSEIYINTGDGNFSSAWAAVTSNADTTTSASPGDLMLYQGGDWDHIPTGGTAPGTDLDIDNRTSTDLEVTSTTGADATIPAATTSLAGLMTAADKTKLDAVPDAGDIAEKDDINDGKLTIKNSDGSTAGEFTANQEGDTDIVLPEGFSGDYDDLINKPDINDGKLTISDADGNSLGEFTANQAGDTPITLPAAPVIGDGTITIVDADGGAVGSFTVNQEGDTEITLPEIPVPEDQIHIGDTYPGTPSLGDLWVDTSECPPVLQIWNDCDGTEEWKPIGGKPVEPINFVARIEDDGTAIGNTPDHVLEVFADNITGGTAPVVSAYKWLRVGVVEIGTAKTYTLTTDDIGTTISCEVTVAEPDGSDAVVRTAVYGKVIEVAGTIDTPEVLAPADGAGSGAARYLISDTIIDVEGGGVETCETDTIDSVDDTTDAPNVILTFPSSNNFDCFADGDVVQQPDVKIIGDPDTDNNTITVDGGEWAPPHDQSQVWSDQIAGTNYSGYPKTLAFNGDFVGKSGLATLPAINSTLTFTPSPAFTTAKKVTIFYYAASLNNNAIQINNTPIGDQLSIAGGDAKSFTYDIPEGEGFTSLAWSRQKHGIEDTGITGVMVDGVPLTDAGVSPDDLVGQDKLVKQTPYATKLTLAGAKDLADLNVGDVVKMGLAADVPYQPVSDSIVTVDDSNADVDWVARIETDTTFNPAYPAVNAVDGDLTSFADSNAGGTYIRVNLKDLFPSGTYTLEVTSGGAKDGVDFITDQETKSLPFQSGGGGQTYTQTVTGVPEYIVCKSTTAVSIYYFKINEEIITDHVTGNQIVLELSGDTDLAYFRKNDLVQGVDPADTYEVRVYTGTSVIPQSFNSTTYVDSPNFDQTTAVSINGSQLLYDLKVSTSFEVVHLDGPLSAPGGVFSLYGSNDGVSWDLQVSGVTQLNGPGDHQFTRLKSTTNSRYFLLRRAEADGSAREMASDKYVPDVGEFGAPAKIIDIDDSVPSITVNGGQWSGSDNSGDPNGDTEVTCLSPLKAPTDWTIEAIEGNTLSLSHATPDDNAQVWVANDNQAGTDFYVTGPSIVDDPLLTADVELESSLFSTTPDGADSLKNIVWELNGVTQDAGTTNPYKPSGLALNTEYTVRVKHQGNSLPDSAWSTSTTFTTGATRNLYTYYQDRIAALVARIEALES